MTSQHWYLTPPLPAEAFPLKNVEGRDKNHHPQQCERHSQTHCQRICSTIKHNNSTIKHNNGIFKHNNGTIKHKNSIFKQYQHKSEKMASSMQHIRKPCGGFFTVSNRGGISEPAGSRLYGDVIQGHVPSSFSSPLVHKHKLGRGEDTQSDHHIDQSSSTLVLGDPLSCTF